MVVVVVAAYAGLFAVLALLVGLGIVISGSWRRNPSAAKAVKICLRGAGALGAYAVVSVVALELVEEFQRPAAPSKSTLSRPQSFDGIPFPTGATVTVSGAPPHHVEAGDLPVPTVISGLSLIGEFHMSADGQVNEGKLAAAAIIDAIPCGIGGFERESGYVACTLAERFTFDGMILAPGEVKIRPGRNGARAMIAYGALAEPARLDGLACAPGNIEFRDNTRRCTLAEDQEIMGFWLASGTQAEVYRQDDGRFKLGDRAILARPVNALGVTLPRWTTLMSLPAVRAEELEQDSLPPDTSVNFYLPRDAVFPIFGGDVHGCMFVSLTSTRISLSDNGCIAFFVLGDRRATSAEFDRSSMVWTLHNEIKAPQ